MATGFPTRFKGKAALSELWLPEGGLYIGGQQLNLSNNQLLAKPTGDATAGITWLEMDPSGTSSADSKPFAIGFQESANTSGAPNIIHHLGWNINGTGGRIDTAEASMLISFEQDYLTGGNRYAEGHWEGQDTNGTTYRAFSMNFQRGAVATTMQITLAGETLFFADFSGNYMLKLEKSTDSIYTNTLKGVTLANVGAGNSVLYNSQNDMGFLVANRSTTGAACLIGLDANNRVAIGAPFSWNEADGIVIGNGRVVGSTTGTDGFNLAVGTVNGLMIGTANTQKIGFNGAVPVVQGTITGSKGANAALTSLLAYLALRGDIVNSTT